MSRRQHFVLDLFDEPWKAGDAERRKVDPEAGGGRRKPVAPKDPPRLRDPKTGEFVTVAEMERLLKDQRDREHELNQENAKRRTENNELKAALKTVVDSHESVKQRAVRTEAMAALTTAKAIDPDVVSDAFLRWAGDKIKVGDNLQVDGLTTELIADFQKAKPKLFETNGAAGGKGEPVLINADTIKPNSTASGLSPGGGTAGNETAGVKLDFSKGKVDDVVAKYKESLR
jgi:hypothetical protein